MSKNGFIIFLILVVIALSALLILSYGKKEVDQEEPTGIVNCAELAEEIVIEEPTANQLVNSPLVLQGKARGGWFFEANLPVRIEDAQGNVLKQWYVMSDQDWMTNEFVAFSGQIDFLSLATSTGKVVFSKDNPSGLPEHDKSCFAPVMLPAMETMEVKVFFNNDELDPEYSCNKVFSVMRQVKKSQAMARTALTELLNGASPAEESEGYFSSINSGVEIQSLSIKDRIAKVDFNERLEFQVGGSCRVSAIRTQIEQTLKQFPTVDEVVISINGRVEDILQP